MFRKSKPNNKQVINMSSIVELKNLSNDDLKKRLASQIALEDWTDECGKCGSPKSLHKELHRDAACIKEQELPNILRENLKEFNKRVKPILMVLKEEFKKDLEQGVLLDGLMKLINSNTENMNKQTENMTSLIISLKDSFKKETVSSGSGSSTVEAGVNKITKLTKPAKVPSWT